MQKSLANEQKCQAEAMEVFMHGNHAMGWHWHWRGQECYACITLRSHHELKGFIHGSEKVKVNICVALH